MDGDIRMEDVARRAGVARSTVSMALRNDESIALPTRQRIQQLARDMGYRPNPMISALMTGLRTGRKEARPIPLAFVSSFPDAIEAGNSTLGEFRRGAADHAKRLGYRLEHFRLKDGIMTPKRLSEILRARGIPGLVLAPFPDPIHALDFDWDSFASVAIGHSLMNPQLHRAVHHQYHGMTLAFDQLYRLGHRRIGLVMTHVLDRRVDYNWTAAFLVKRLTHAADFPMLVSDDWDEERFRQWFKKEKPDAIISVLAEVPRWLQKLGVRVPEEVGYATLDRCTGTRWPGIHQNSEMVAAAALDLLVEQLYHNCYGVPENPKSVLIEGRWME